MSPTVPVKRPAGRPPGEVASYVNEPVVSSSKAAKKSGKEIGTKKESQGKGLSY